MVDGPRLCTGSAGLGKARLPRQFTPGAYSPGDPSGEIRVLFEQFDLPPVPGVLITRELDVSAVRIPAGQTYLMAKSQVIWLPARPSSSLVPAGTRAVIVSYAGGRSGTFPLDNRPATPPPPVTVADPARVRQIAVLVNGLGEVLPGPHFCPAEHHGEEKLILTFLDRAGGATLAVYIVDLGACGGVADIVGGVPQPSLQSSGQFVQELRRIAGI